MQQGTIHGKHQVRVQPSICITNCAECESARRRRSRRDDAGDNHAQQRARDCTHQSTNDVGFRPFLTCSIAACDNDGGGAPEAVVIPPCNSATEATAHEPMASAHATAPPPSNVMNSRRFMCGWPPPGKRKCNVPHRSRLQSCVRPVHAVRMDCWP